MRGPTWAILAGFSDPGYRSGSVELSVVIPTRERPTKIGACVARLAFQSIDPGQFEVLVGLDGSDEASAEAARAAWREAGGLDDSLRIVPCPRAGLNATRNRLLERASGRLLVSMNDDVLADPGFLEAHSRAHREAGDRAIGDAIVVGHSPFLEHAEPTLFDELCQRTSMIFFYDQMIGPAEKDRWHDWGFRHCWGLNFSAPLALIRRVGGFTAFPLLYGYDDIEIAWRIRRESRGVPVLFRPEALAPHDHRYSPAEVIGRERKLGRTAWHFASRDPGFTRDVFARDIRSAEELEYSRGFVTRERAGVERVREQFLSLDRIPAAALGGASEADRHTLLAMLYQQHLPLKRWEWRSGLLEAAAEQPLREVKTQAGTRVS